MSDKYIDSFYIKDKNGNQTYAKIQIPLENVDGATDLQTTAAAAENKLSSLKEQADFHEQIFLQSNIITSFDVTSSDYYISRETADGASVMDNSLARIKKIEGNSRVVGKDANGLNGKIEHASFSGIKSISPNDEESVFKFPETELPLGVKIDFEQKKIINYGVTIVLTGDENIAAYNALNANGIRIYGVLKNNEIVGGKYPTGYCTDGLLAETVSVGDKKFSLNYPIGIGYPSNEKDIFWAGFMDKFHPNNLTAEGAKAYLAQRYADGNPVTIHYISSTLQSEENLNNIIFNSYQVQSNGTEVFIDKNNMQSSIGLKSTINYINPLEV